MIIPVFAPSIQPAVEPAIFSGSAPAIQRYFTTLSAAQQFVPESTVTLATGDRAISVDFYCAIIDGVNRLIFNSTKGMYISISVNGLFCRINYFGINIPVSNVLVGLNRVRVWRSQSLQTMYAQLNGGTIYSLANTNNLSTNITTIGGSFSGVVANVMFWSGSIDFDSTPTYSWAIDSDGSTSTETATNGNINLTRVNLTQADTELFTLNEATTPVQWENSDQSVIIPVRY